jgi:hypothetical protein
MSSAMINSTLGHLPSHGVTGVGGAGGRGGSGVNVGGGEGVTPGWSPEVTPAAFLGGPTAFLSQQ